MQQKKPYGCAPLLQNSVVRMHSRLPSIAITKGLSRCRKTINFTCRQSISIFDITSSARRLKTERYRSSMCRLTIIPRIYSRSLCRRRSFDDSWRSWGCGGWSSRVDDEVRRRIIDVATRARDVSRDVQQTRVVFFGTRKLEGEC